MSRWTKYGDKILKRLGKIAISLACCCNGTPCCNRLNPPGDVPEHLPETLRMILTDTGGTCSCIDGIEIELTWNVTNSQYEGVGPGGICPLLSEYWRLSCVGANPDVDATDCQHWQLSTQESTVCIMIGDPFFANADCTCDPLHLVYDIAFSGLGCCDSGDGVRSMRATIDEI